MAAHSLPPSVEATLHRICQEHSLPLPEPMALEKLYLLGEGPSLDILQEILKSPDINNLTALIIHMVEKEFQTETAKESVSSPGPQNSCSGSQQCNNEAISSLVSGKMANADEASLSPVGLKKSQRQTSPHLQALGELEFRKAFLILSYIGKNELEDVLSIDDLESLKNLPMASFESELWEVVGQNCLPETDRRKNIDWDSENACAYQCHVDHDGKCTFKGPYLQNTRTHLQRVLGDDNVLIVRFADLDERGPAPSVDDRNALYHRVAKEVFKDGGKAVKKKSPTSSSVKCYFVCTESDATLDEKRPNILFGKSIHEARCLFMHIHTVPNMAKYMARFNLILSDTTKLDIDFGSVHIQRIEDIPCLDEEGKAVYKEDGEPSIHTDGTGFISEDLAVKCLGTPLLIQFRLFYNGCAMKGTLLVNKKLPLNTIQIRPSMIKVETDPQLSNVQSINSLEIVSTSNQPRKTYLSKTLISLLNYGGVPKEYFMDLLRHALNDAQNVRSNKRIALKEELKSVKQGRLYASDCYYLMGTADPTGTLNANEVCVFYDGQISGNILVYKPPGLHFGDIHVVTTTYIQDLENVVGNAKYVIFFPTKGPRSLADEMANSDLDGDKYWVSRNTQLLDHFKASKPWEPVSSKSKVQQHKPPEFSAEELEHELFQQFLVNRFEPSHTMATAADSWLSFMDGLLMLGDECGQEKDCLQEKMIKLINIYYDAVDASKTGLKVEVPEELKAEKFPHYMEKHNSYHSNSILGMIYDKKHEKSLASVEKFPILAAMEHNSQYQTEMACAMSMDGESKNAAADEIIHKYKQIFYGAAEFKESMRNRGKIFSDALTTYQLSYFHAKISGVGRCSFTWKVAGRALVGCKP